MLTAIIVTANRQPYLAKGADMYCTVCGGHNRAGIKECAVCGAEIDAGTATTFPPDVRGAVVTSGIAGLGLGVVVGVLAILAIPVTAEFGFNRLQYWGSAWIAVAFGVVGYGLSYLPVFRSNPARMIICLGVAAVFGLVLAGLSQAFLTFLLSFGMFLYAAIVGLVIPTHMPGTSFILPMWRSFIATSVFCICFAMSLALITALTSGLGWRAALQGAAIMTFAGAVVATVITSAAGTLPPFAAGTHPHGVDIWISLRWAMSGFVFGVILWLPSHLFSGLGAPLDIFLAFSAGAVCSAAVWALLCTRGLHLYALAGASILILAGFFLFTVLSYSIIWLPSAVMGAGVIGVALVQFMWMPTPPPGALVKLIGIVAFFCAVAVSTSLISIAYDESGTGSAIELLLPLALLILGAVTALSPGRVYRAQLTDNAVGADFGEDFISIPSSERNSGLALLLSLLVCGAGQIYNGQIAKGIGMMLFYVVLGVLSVLSYWVGILVDSPLLILAPLTIPVVWVYGFVDAYQTAEGINHKIQGAQRRCPYCDELIRVRALVCPHCRRELVPTV
ncbi:MAG: hypothetical protein HW403_589 [Dehalococcoidia bacterium]|nr:hypothetical protein [Dehalococcoidia bacterium]